MGPVKDVIVKQSGSFDALISKLKVIKPDSQSILESLMALQATAKRKLDPADIMKFEQVSKQFRDYEHRIFSSINQEGSEIRDALVKMYEIAGLNTAEVAQAISFEMAVVTSTEGDQNASAEPGESMSAELDRLRTENSILNVQIENAQQLAKTTVQKNAELEAMLIKSGEYGESLEGEVEQLKKSLNESLQGETELESERRRLIEGVEAANDNAYRGTVDSESIKEKLAERENRIIALEKEIVKERQVAENKIEAVELLKEKDEQYKKIERKAEQLKTDYDNMKKDSNSLHSKIISLEAERKDLSKRLEKLSIEKETARQTEKSLDIKINMSSNLLSQARKTISKLTSENEELRQDRLKYIGKTKDIIAEQKALAGRAVILATQVQTEAQRARALAEQLEAVKKREADNQKSGGEALKAKVTDLEKKLDSLRLELKESNQRFVQEQKKVLSTEQELKSLRNKSKAS